MGRCTGGILLCVVAAAAQGKTGGPQEILHRVAAAYAAVQGYRVEAFVTGAVFPGPAQTTVAITYGAPDRLRLQDKSRREVTAYHDHGVSRYNGQSTVFLNNPASTARAGTAPLSYDPFPPEWVAQGKPMPDPMDPMPSGPPPPPKQPSFDDQNVRSHALVRIGFADYTAIEKQVKSARVLRQEDIKVGDETAHCTVVEATYPHGQTRTFWVDPIRYTVLREVSAAPGAGERTMEVRKLEWNVPIPNSEFELKDLAPHMPSPNSRGAVMIKPGCGNASVAPEEARIAGLAGRLKITYTVDASGRPADIRVENPLGLGVEEAAVQCLSLSEFQPKMKDGQPVSSQVTMFMSVGGVSSVWHLSRAMFHTEKDATRPYFLMAPYPQEQVRRFGVFQLQLTIDKSGIPRVIRVTAGVDPKLDKEAAAIVKRWRFRPGRASGQAVDTAADFELTLGLPGTVKVPLR